jgi:hypothetical protein
VRLSDTLNRSAGGVIILGGGVRSDQGALTCDGGHGGFALFHHSSLASYSGALFDSRKYDLIFSIASDFSRTKRRFGNMAKKNVKPSEPTGKLVTVVSLLKRKKGATVEQIADAIDWQMRGAWTAISRVRQLGFDVVSVKRHGGDRVYRIAA